MGEHISDDGYPPRLKEKLGATAPAVLYGAGEHNLLSRAFLAVVGSRDVDESGAEFAHRMGEACASDAGV